MENLFFYFSIGDKNAGITVRDLDEYGILSKGVTKVC